MTGVTEQGNIELRKPSAGEVGAINTEEVTNTSTVPGNFLTEALDNLAAAGGIILTTKGDLLSHNGAAAIRIPVGATDGWSLQVDALSPGGIKWAAGGGGGDLKADGSVPMTADFDEGQQGIKNIGAAGFKFGVAADQVQYIDVDIAGGLIKSLVFNMPVQWANGSLYPRATVVSGPYAPGNEPVGIFLLTDKTGADAVWMTQAYQPAAGTPVIMEMIGVTGWDTSITYKDDTDSLYFTIESIAGVSLLKLETGIQFKFGSSYIKENGTDLEFSDATGTKKLSELLSPLTTDGDIMSYDTGADVRLAIGAAGEVLTVSVGGAPEWAVASGGSPLTTKGDLFGFSTVDARLPVGTNAQMIVADDTAGVGMKWAPSIHFILTVKGDMVASDGSAPAALNIGSNGQVLTADNLELTGMKWVTPYASPLTTNGDIMSHDIGVDVRLAIGAAGEVLTVSVGGAPEWAVAPGGSPLTTKGDLFGFSTVDARFPVGANAQMIVADDVQAIGMKWAPSIHFILIIKGDMVASDGSAPAVLNVGSDGQVLTADNLELTGMKWATPYASPLTTDGDIMSYDTGADVRLAIGAAGEVLTVSVGGAPEWAVAPGGSPLTTKGDLFGFSTVDARLSVGTNGQIIVADDTAGLGLKWETPATIPTLTYDAVVASSGGDYTTLGAAITAGKNTVFIKLGTVTETDNITLPADCFIMGEGEGAIVDMGIYSLTTAARSVLCNFRLEFDTTTGRNLVTIGGDDNSVNMVAITCTNVPSGFSYMITDNNVARTGLKITNCKLQFAGDFNNSRGIKIDSVDSSGLIIDNILFDSGGGDITGALTIDAHKAIISNINSIVDLSSPTVYAYQFFGTDQVISNISNGSITLEGINQSLNNAVNTSVIRLEGSIDKCRISNCSTALLSLSLQNNLRVTGCDIETLSSSDASSFIQFSACRIVNALTSVGSNVSFSACMLAAVTIDGDDATFTGGMATSFTVNGDNAVITGVRTSASSTIAGTADGTTFNSNKHAGLTDSGTNTIKVGNNPDTP